jgi:hypothetical protein
VTATTFPAIRDIAIPFPSRLDYDEADERAHHVLDLIVDGLRSRG